MSRIKMKTICYLIALLFWCYNLWVVGEFFRPVVKPARVLRVKSRLCRFIYFEWHSKLSRSRRTFVSSSSRAHFRATAGIVWLLYPFKTCIYFLQSYSWSLMFFYSRVPNNLLRMQMLLFRKTIVLLFNASGAFLISYRQKKVLLRVSPALCVQKVYCRKISGAHFIIYIRMRNSILALACSYSHSDPVIIRLLLVVQTLHSEKITTRIKNDLQSQLKLSRYNDFLNIRYWWDNTKRSLNVDT